MISIHLTSLPM